MTAAGLGLEPRYLGPKPSVLPLDDPAMGSEYNKTGRTQTLAPLCAYAMIHSVVHNGGYTHARREMLARKETWSEMQ